MVSLPTFLSLHHQGEFSRTAQLAYPMLKSARGWVTSPSLFVLGAGLLMSLLPDLLCCPGEVQVQVQGLLFCLLQAKEQTLLFAQATHSRRGAAHLLTHSGSALLCCPGDRWASSLQCCVWQEAGPSQQSATGSSPYQGLLYGFWW